MAEKTLIICDICDDKKAIEKCQICEKDVCNYCSKYIRIGEETSLYFAIIAISNNKKHLLVCKECIANIKSLIKDVRKMKPEDQNIFTKELIGFVKYRLPQIITASKI